MFFRRSLLTVSASLQTLNSTTQFFASTRALILHAAVAGLPWTELAAHSHGAPLAGLLRVARHVVVHNESRHRTVLRAAGHLAAALLDVLWPRDDAYRLLALQRTLFGSSVGDAHHTDEHGACRAAPKQIVGSLAWLTCRRVAVAEDFLQSRQPFAGEEPLARVALLRGILIVHAPFLCSDVGAPLLFRRLLPGTQPGAAFR